MKKNDLNLFFLGFVKLTGILPALLFFKPKVYLLNKNAKRRLPHPAILMSNHTSLMDFVLYLILFPFTTIRFLMAEVLYNKGKAFATFLNMLGGIRVDRDTFDMDYVEKSLEVLDRKGIIGIFPEGRLPVNHVPFPFKGSISFIASKTDAPIIPIYTDGNYGLFKRAHVIIGEPIYVGEKLSSQNPSAEELKALTEFLQKETYALKDVLEERRKKNEAKS